MNAKELRIGNLVYELEEETTIDIADISNMYYSDLNDGTIIYNPIPLTEDWLVKFGFDGLDHTGKYLFELIYNSVIGYRYSIESQYGYPEIKHVHQLQNLYFALTNEELKIKK